MNQQENRNNQDGGCVIINKFDGYVDRCENGCYCVSMVDQNGFKSYGTIEENKLKEKGIFVGDSFLCVLYVDSNNKGGMLFSPLSKKLTDEDYAEAQRMLDEYMPDDSVFEKNELEN